MFASERVYQNGQSDHITASLDGHDPEARSRLQALRAGFRGYLVVEDLDGRYLRVKLYPGLAMELLR